MKTTTIEAFFKGTILAPKTSTTLSKLFGLVEFSFLPKASSGLKLWQP